MTDLSTCVSIWTHNFANEMSMQVYERVSDAYIWLRSKAASLWQHRPTVDAVKLILDGTRTVLAVCNALHSMTQPATA